MAVSALDAWTRGRRRNGAFDSYVRSGCAVVVAGVAAYSSYVHQRAFALQGGADPVSAALWPLSVDGLLVLATVGLLRLGGEAGLRERWVVWAAFLLGILVSLAANIAAAPALAWRPVLVAGWPPVALLLSVELLAHRRAGDDQPTGEGDPLLDRALAVNARHWESHQRPISAASLRKELRIGTARARHLVALVRSRANGA